jgi:hypothetical protein
MLSLIPLVELLGVGGGGVQDEKLDAHGSVLLGCG